MHIRYGSRDASPAAPGWISPWLSLTADGGHVPRLHVSVLRELRNLSDKRSRGWGGGREGVEERERGREGEKGREKWKRKKGSKGR